MKLTLGLIFAGHLGLLLSSAAQEASQAVVNASQSDAAIASSQLAGQPPVLTIREGRLTLQVLHGSLGLILDEVAQAAKITIVRGEGVGDDLVSVDLRNTPLERGLQEILRNQDSFFLYGAEGNSPASLKKVWVYPKGQARGLQPGPPEAWASVKEIEAKLANADALVRSRAYEALLERKGELALNAINRLVKEEKDDDVRTRVLSAALNSGLQLPVDLRISLASADPAEEVRLIALDTLRGDSNLAAIATGALTDPSPNVRIRAQEIINELNAASLPPTASEQDQ